MSGLNAEWVDTVAAVAAVAFVGSALYQNYAQQRRARETKEKIERIEIRAAEQPEKIRFAWDLASTKLEAYFDRNLNQVKSIFWVAIVVMMVGFGFIMYGIARSINDPQSVKVAWVSALSGIVTEFIGASFMLIYRSTMQQASAFMHVLERINSVGMAVQILDSITDESSELKNATRADLVKILLSSSRGPNRWELGSPPQPPLKKRGKNAATVAR